jgi:thiamine monophosphate synthase
MTVPAAPRLLIVTNRGLLPLDRLADVLERLLDRVPSGSVGVYHREPDLPEAEVRRELAALVAVCGRSGRCAPVYGRGEPAWAAEAGAAGVQLQAGGVSPEEVHRCRPSLRVGYSAHAETEAEAAAPFVDHLTFSPVFASPGKGVPVGIERLSSACRRCAPVPVLALGGIETAERARVAAAAGAHGVAAIRGVLSAGDPAEAARRLLRAVRPGRGFRED